MLKTNAIKRFGEEMSNPFVLYTNLFPHDHVSDEVKSNVQRVYCVDL